MRRCREPTQGLGTRNRGTEAGEFFPLCGEMSKT